MKISRDFGGTTLEKEFTPVVLDVSQMKAVWLYSEPGGIITTNALLAGAYDDRIDFAEDQFYYWAQGMPNVTNPFTADVTKFYYTSASAGLFEMRVLYDPTI